MPILSLIRCDEINRCSTRLKVFVLKMVGKMKALIKYSYSLTTTYKSPDSRYSNQKMINLLFGILPRDYVPLLLSRPNLGRNTTSFNSSSAG
jgi:hypothetical protein